MEHITQQEDASPHWYAFKVFFNKVFEIDQTIRERNVQTYFPVVRTYKLSGDHHRLVQKPAISSLIFVRCAETEVWEIQRQLYGQVILYSHKTDGTKVASAIDEEEMRLFMLVTSVEDERLQYLDVESVNYKEGQKVRVLDGPYKDCVGYIKRIKGNRRLLVAVEGIALVATSYIPSVFLEKIN